MFAQPPYLSLDVHVQPQSCISSRTTHRQQRIQQQAGVLIHVEGL